MARKRIGELLLEQRAISVAQLEAGLSAHRKSGQRLGATLIAQGAITEATLAGALSQALGMPQVDLAAVTPEWAAVHMLRARFCEQHDLFPIALESVGGRRQLVVAMSDPLNVPAVEEIEFTTGLKVSVRVAALSAVRGAILRYYHKVPVATASGTAAAAPPRPAPAARPRPAVPAKPAPVTPEEDDEEVIVGEELPPGETTQRTSLAELIRTREEQRKQKREQSAAKPKPASGGGVLDDLDYLFGQAREDPDRVEELERKFWALMRIMARKGLLTNEEFSRELDDEDKPQEG
ncbi:MULTISPECIES: general secretion pathway protein GspE [unclassified Myxococcus]|uniref:GspE/PulE/PilB domain-containing protein n=1 Tax=Myxococcus TaxID=32 RepID=UPI001CBE4045|nr:MULTISPECIES: general secretion pathway protein GspE [unclassified Myxococcus]MBZ4396526.1 general secretion pathway protein GspE [Myxococcus sp. AS-1-15]MBZ4411767.1 general secretion pathway protein GspE [Myxococcus sp. XM-1-1-1]